MRRRIVAVWVSLAMLFGIVAIVDVVTDITPTAKATTLYVNETGSGGAFTSIQDAVDAASDGDTVYVYSGNYLEKVVVNKTINLTGENKDTTIIEVGGDIEITSNWVNVSGFTVIGNGPSSGDYGIQLNSVYNCYIYNNTALMNSHGIESRFSHNNNITHNNVSNNNEGILLSDSSGNNITNNNASHNDREGIRLSFSILNNFIGNNVTNNENGIGLHNSNNNTMALLQKSNLDHIR